MILRPLLVFLLLLGSGVSQAKEQCLAESRLSFGMVPAVSSNLAELWSRVLNKQATDNSCIRFRFSSARNFTAYINKAQQGNYDVFAAPAHIASYLISESGFKPVGFLVWESSYLYVVPNESSIQTIDDKTIKALALPDPASETSIRAQLDVPTGSNIEVEHFQHYKKIVQVVLSGEVDAGVVLAPFYNAYKKHTKIKVRPIHEVPFPSHGMLVAAPHLSDFHINTLFDVFSPLDQSSGLFWKKFEAPTAEKMDVLHKTQKQTVEGLKQILSKQN